MGSTVFRLRWAPASSKSIQKRACCPAKWTWRCALRPGLCWGVSGPKWPAPHTPRRGSDSPLHFIVHVAPDAIGAPRERTTGEGDDCTDPRSRSDADGPDDSHAAEDPTAGSSAGSSGGVRNPSSPPPEPEL